MEVFTDSDVTQSYQATTRTYERPSDIDSMTDEDELLEIYLAVVIPACLVMIMSTVKS
jgi:hypothetical protein